METLLPKLALDLDRPNDSREGVMFALENARALVNRAMDELRNEGATLEQMIRDAAPD